MRTNWDRMVSRTLRNRRGMTLIEIMVVIAIIGILSTAIGYGVVTYLQKAKIDACKAQLRTIANAVDMYAASDEYPNDLSALTEGTGAPLKESQLKDPWKQEITYNHPAQRGSGEFDLCSKGPDKKQNTDDDICHD